MADTAQLGEDALTFEKQADEASAAGDLDEAARLTGAAAFARHQLAAENAYTSKTPREVVVREKAARLEREADKTREHGAAAHLELGRRNAEEEARVTLLNAMADELEDQAAIAAETPDGEFIHTNADGEEVVRNGSQEQTRLLAEAKKTRARIAGEKGA